MTQEERYKITSNDYADIFVIYNGNENILAKYQANSVHIMNERFAIAYLPVSQITANTISQLTYSAIPACYGLVSRQSLEASGVTRLRRMPNFNLRGTGVVIGFIDTGIDYTNPIFQHEDGTTRINTIWDQTIDSEDRYPPGTYYGTVYTADQINQALKSQTPFDIVPSRDENGHGTALAGIAAGSEDSKNDFSGVAPDSELIVVKLKQAKQNLMNFFAIPTNVPCFQENDIMWGAQYIIQEARRLKRPVAICIGLGSSQGSHDGRGSLSSLLSLEGDFPGVVVCNAAGNEGNTRRHFYGSIDPAIGNTTVELNVGENETGFTMELWGNSPNTYSIDILSPSGEYIPRIAESLRVNRQISFVFENTLINIDYMMVESQAGDELILLRFQKPTPGIWRFQVYGRGDLQSSFHIWLPMGDFISRGTYFIQPNPYTTITSPGNGLVPITVTAYNPENDTLYQGSSRGYSRINIVKPELAAPGVNIQGPNLNHGYTNYTGTGVATAHAAGISAMLLEWAIVKNNYPGVDSVEVKNFLIRGAKRNANLVYPNRDWGYGIIDIFSVFDILRADVQRRS